MAIERPSRFTFSSARSLLLRWLINSLALFAADFLIDGIHFSGPGWQMGVVALIFGLVNTLLRPLLLALTCPLIILTLGLFGLVVNALLLELTAALATQVGIDFQVESFWAALLGGLVISLVGLALSVLAGEQRVVIQTSRGPEE